jgi:hypothetical protein
MFSGAETEWLPTLGESWQIPQVPWMTGRPVASLSPPTPVMLMVRELKSVCPRRILARRAAASPEDALTHELLIEHGEDHGIKWGFEGVQAQGIIDPDKEGLRDDRLRPTACAVGIE